MIALAPILTSPYPIDPMPVWVIDLRVSAEPVWVFAYGSLMWNPEMRFAERLPARVHGWHRSFCLYSPEYRGTREKPGLVLGLDRGGSCRGIAYRLAPATLAAEIDLLWTREMTGEVYDLTPVKLTTGAGPVAAYAFTVRRQSRDYAGRLALEDAARRSSYDMARMLIFSRTPVERDSPAAFDFRLCGRGQRRGEERSRPDDGVVFRRI